MPIGASPSSRWSRSNPPPRGHPLPSTARQVLVPRSVAAILAVPFPDRLPRASHNRSTRHQSSIAESSSGFRRHALAHPARQRLETESREELLGRKRLPADGRRTYNARCRSSPRVSLCARLIRALCTGHHLRPDAADEEAAPAPSTKAIWCISGLAPSWSRSARQQSCLSSGSRRRRTGAPA